MDESPPTLRILCFGDSLTAGYSYFGVVYHPYEERLNDRLTALFPNLKVDCCEEGMAGDKILSRLGGIFYSRMMRATDRSTTRFDYDWVIILGGTNDLALNGEPEEMYRSIQDIWSFPLNRGSKVLALTVPEVGVRGADRPSIRGSRRDHFNQLVKRHQADNFYVCDLDKELTYWGMSEEDRQLYWDDGVHLTPDGYDLMGDKIADRLIEILRAEGLRGEMLSEAPGSPIQPEEANQSTPPPRRAFKDDDLVFDEENGDGSLLNKGYVVVRKIDLE